MAKCDIRITFDNPDRNYRGGDRVSGEVHIQVNEDIRCNGIKLTHHWKTHGRGNTDSGAKNTIQLSEMVPLSAGEELHFPFEFEAGRWPLTYHGHYICVDHFVHVAVDVPWAIDPKHEEEFIVAAGERPPEFTGGRGEIVAIEKKTTEVKGAWKIVLYTFLALIVIMLSFALLFLIPIFLIGGGGYWIWKKVIASRVGEVNLKVSHVVVGPGEQWPIELTFTPKKTFPVNGITLKIVGQEAATSGSGTNATTHTHTLFEELHTIYPEGMLTAGKPFSERFVVELPETDAWSLAESDNKINWTAETRIDIPRFPDWKEKTVLQMIPPEFLDGADPARPEEPAAAVGYPAPKQHAPAAAVPSTNDWSASRDTVEYNDDDSDQDLAPLLTIVEGIRQAGRFGKERSEIVAGVAGQSFDVVMLIDRISTTFGYSGDDDRFEQGRTVIAKIAGTDQEIQLFTVAASKRLAGRKHTRRHMANPGHHRKLGFTVRPPGSARSAVRLVIRFQTLVRRTVLPCRHGVKVLIWRRKPFRVTACLIPTRRQVSEEFNFDNIRSWLTCPGTR